MIRQSRRGAAMLFAALIASTSLAADAAGTLADPAASQLCVDLINQKRATLSLPPLARWQDGEALAASQAFQDGRDHTPHGAYRRRIQSGVHETSAQNECYNTDARSAPMIRICIDDMFGEGPENHDGKVHGHYVNMTSTRYGKVACGFAIAPDGSMWSVQNFATDARAAARTPVDGGAFDRQCVGAINQLRATAQLPPYSSWKSAGTCVTRLAALEARNARPNDADTACLGPAWGYRACGSSETEAGAALETCVRHAWNAPPDASHRSARDDLASRSYHEAACGFARGADGTATIVEVFR